jgi:hypothetical protein
MGKNQDPDPGSTSQVRFPRAYKQFFGLKCLNSLMRIRIRDPRIFLTLDPGWEKFGSGINIPISQHCFLSVIFAFLNLDSDPQAQLNPNRKTSVADPDPVPF